MAKPALKSFGGASTKLVARGDSARRSDIASDTLREERGSWSAVD
jgi:hypothetical protein